MAIDPKSLTPSVVSLVQNKNDPIAYTFALSLFLFFFLSSFQVEHLIISWSSPCTNIIFLAPPLGLYQLHLIHTLSIKVSIKVSSISQNQIRAFNLPLFGN
jgi:hypothetical protein